MDRKKELKEQYKQMKPDMGIFIIQSISSNYCYIESTKNLRGTMNSAKFKLEANSHQNKKLQKVWNDLGAGNFKIEILEILEYDKDEIKTDYSEELALLQMIWEEKLANEQIRFY